MFSLSQLNSCSGGAQFEHFRMIELVHSNGVNIRYLGHVRSYSTSEALRYLLLLEMLARLLKVLILKREKDKRGNIRYLDHALLFHQ